MDYCICCKQKKAIVFSEGNGIVTKQYCKECKEHLLPMIYEESALKEKLRIAKKNRWLLLILMFILGFLISVIILL